MKQLNTFLKRYFLFSIFIAWTYTSSSQDVEKSTHSSQQQPQAHENSDNIKLDKGKKWIANPETTQGIRNMISNVNAFTSGTASKDYTVLKQKLETEFNLILQRCTMKGEAHNQLHNYLMPLNDLIRQLQDKNHAQESLTALKTYLNKYFDYFQ